MKLRSFVALEIPTNVQLSIVTKISPLIQRYPKPLIRWVKSENIHLTLRFLSDRTNQELTSLANSLRKEINTLEPFTFKFSSLGTFPNPRKPRVIWIGIDAPVDLIKIQCRIEEICTRFGFQKENRQFTPHITLGRVNNSEFNLNLSMLSKDIASISLESIEQVEIKGIKIIKSDLKPSGPFYTIIHDIPFGILS